MSRRNHTRIKIVSADIARDLRRLSENSVPVNHITRCSEFEAILCIQNIYADKAIQVLSKYSESVAAESTRENVIQIVKRRFVLITSILLLLFLTVLIPTRVFFIRVDGNSFIPTDKILEAAYNSGICFGAKRSDVRSEEVKNKMLKILPQLQWAGINTSGCVAQISVKDKANIHESGNANIIDEIVALRDGIICSVTATEGTLLCKVGQAVTKGQTLVSGYTDVGIQILKTQPKAEIYALTKHQIKACTICKGSERGGILYAKKQYSLQIGKNFIKLYNGSGIYPPGCVKMYERKDLVLPGGFVLPFSVIIETVKCSELASSADSTCPEHPWLKTFSDYYTSSQMIAGSILTGDTKLSCQSGIAYVEGIYVCREMICDNKEYNADDE